MLEESVAEVSRVIRTEGEKKIGCLGMGTTIAVALVTFRHAHIAYMGDSRVYLLRSSELRLLTEDHSIVGTLLRHGEISPQEAVDHPARGRLTRFVGMEPGVDPAGKTIELQVGDRLMLCTDGLWGTMSEHKIRDILLARDTCEVTCRDLIATGKAVGGEDNLTVVVVDALASEYRDGSVIYHEFPPPRRIWKAMKVDHAKALIERGEFHLTDILDYRNAESKPMRDETEGILICNLNGKTHTTYGGNPVLAWCATTENDPNMLLDKWEQYDAVIEITDCMELCRRAGDACVKSGIDWCEIRAGYAKYDRGEEQYCMPLPGHGFVQKSEEYKDQKEYRFCVVVNPDYVQRGQLALIRSPRDMGGVNLVLGSCSDIVRIVAQKEAKPK
jgi:serine/threonine protein phosphatase PrpC